MWSQNSEKKIFSFPSDSPNEELFIKKLAEKCASVSVTFGARIPHCYSLIPLLSESKLALKEITEIIVQNKS